MIKKHLFLRVLISCLMILGTASTRAWAGSARQIYQKASPAVVLIIALMNDGNGASQGTGFLVSKKGWVVTNAHVILDEQTKQPLNSIYVFLKPDKITGDVSQDLTRRYVAKVIQYNAELDLALLQFTPPAGFAPKLSLANPTSVQPGDEVVAIGHPEQGGVWSLTKGVVSTVQKDFEGVKGKDIFQMDTSLNRGNSGGPLLDADAHVVGINTAIARKAQDGLAITGVNFAIQSGVIRAWMNEEGMPLEFASSSLINQSAAPERATQPKENAQAEEAPTASNQVSTDNTNAPAEKSDEEKKQDQAVSDILTPDAVTASSPASSDTSSTQPQKHKKSIKWDFKDRKHPYSKEDMNSFVSALEKKSEDFFKDMDKDIKKNRADQGQTVDSKDSPADSGDDMSKFK